MYYFFHFKKYRRKRYRWFLSFQFFRVWWFSKVILSKSNGLLKRNFKKNKLRGVFRSWNNSFVFHVWKKEEKGKEGNSALIFVVSLPIPNVLRILAGKYWSVFMPCHPTAWLLSQQPALMSCASESSLCLQTSALEAGSTTKRMFGIQNTKFLLFSARNDFPSSKGTATTQVRLPRLKSLSKMSSSHGLDLNQVSGKEG